MNLTNESFLLNNTNSSIDLSVQEDNSISILGLIVLTILGFFLFLCLLGMIKYIFCAEIDCNYTKSILFYIKCKCIVFQSHRNDNSISDTKEFVTINKVFNPSINSKNLVVLDDKSDKYCSICMNNFDEEENKVILKLECGHYFHELCLKEWYSNSEYKDCPNCKTDIKIDKYFI